MNNNEEQRVQMIVPEREIVVMLLSTTLKPRTSFSSLEICCTVHTSREAFQDSLLPCCPGRVGFVTHSIIVRGTIPCRDSGVHTCAAQFSDVLPLPKTVRRQRRPQKHRLRDLGREDSQHTWPSLRIRPYISRPRYIVVSNVAMW